jgi:hypothetical protein
MASRVTFKKVDGIDRFFTTEFLNFLVQLVDLFDPWVQHIRKKRAALLNKALKSGKFLIDDHHH